MIAFIACSKRKLRYTCKAKYMYTGTLFRKSFEYARRNAWDVYIMSAKYGLVSTEELIHPYDLSLYSMSKEERVEWRAEVERQIKERGLSQPFIFLTGNMYCEGMNGEKPFLHMNIVE